MRNSKVIMGVAVAVCLAVLCPSAAHAFFPLGAYNQYSSIVYFKWSWGSLNDANNDRDISGPDEGVPILFEGGDLGWTNAEIETIKQAFGVWQDVPTSYIGFHFLGVNEDPLTYNEIGETVAGDLVNYIAIQLPDDPIQQADVGNGVLGITLLTSAIDDGWTEFIDGSQVYVSGGQILEADIVIDGAAHRAAEPGTKPEAALLGTMVHEIGHFVGLGHTPLNNLELTPTLMLQESPAVMLSDATGVAKLVGATPTMFPIYFEVDDGEGGYKDGGGDLAPDDIAGVSFLYPRGTQSNFFTITEEARSRTRDGFPSVPLGGAHIVAWCDTDNDPLTRRIPLFSTTAGLYELYPANVGRFNLNGLYKELESGYGGAPFQATYTLTCCPLNQYSLERQSPPGYPAEVIDSILGGADTYLTPVYPSEVFHEEGNVYGIDNYDVGTVVTYDTPRGTVVSSTTGKSLAAMLPSPTPMFGDSNKVCPYNVGVAAGLSPVTSDKLRAFRDNILLKSSVGTMLVDAYYRMSPAMARYLINHTGAVKVLRGVTAAGIWTVEHSETLLGVWIIVIAVAMWRRKKLAAAAVLLLASGLFVSDQAQALIANLNDEQMVSMADDIVTGKITAVNAVWKKTSTRKYIVTNVTIKPSDTVKAAVNKGTVLPLRIPGGRKGNIMTTAADFPQFEVGQEVVLYLKYQQSSGTYTIVAGNRGKYDVLTDSTGKKYVYASSLEAAAALKASASSIQKKSDDTAKVQDQEPQQLPLDDFKNYLRDIANRQKQK